MECNNCGQQSDWVGSDSNWTRAGSQGAVIALFECEVCGNKQRGR